MSKFVVIMLPFGTASNVKLVPNTPVGGKLVAAPPLTDTRSKPPKFASEKSMPSNVSSVAPAPNDVNANVTELKGVIPVRLPDVLVSE